MWWDGARRDAHGPRAGTGNPGRARGVLSGLECDQPLCRYALEELKLAGIISGTSRPVAVLESPKGRGYPVYSGTRVGRHGGVVKQVLRDAIVVAEYWPTPDGQLRASEVVLRVTPEAPLALEE